MAAAIPAGVVKVAESGVRDARRRPRLADAGYDAVLVGETLVTAADPAQRRDLLAAEHPSHRTLAGAARRSDANTRTSADGPVDGSAPVP